MPEVLVLGAVVVALLSSALPHSLELLSLRRLPKPVFAVLKSVDPAIAGAAGLIVPGQTMGPMEVLVVAASAAALRMR